MKKKLFILDNKCVEKTKSIIENLVRLLDYKELDLEIKTSKEEIINYLPRDYDVYILHLSNINEKDLENLRNEQPWSWIYGLTGKGTSEKILDIIDREYFLPSKRQFEYIFEEIKNYRKNKQ